MAAGKMTAALELYAWAKENNINSGFVPLGKLATSTIWVLGFP